MAGVDPSSDEDDGGCTYFVCPACNLVLSISPSAAVPHAVPYATSKDPPVVVVGYSQVLLQLLYLSCGVERLLQRALSLACNAVPIAHAAAAAAARAGAAATGAVAAVAVTAIAAMAVAAAGAAAARRPNAPRNEREAEAAALQQLRRPADAAQPAARTRPEITFACKNPDTSAGLVPWRIAFSDPVGVACAIYAMASFNPVRGINYDPMHTIGGVIKDVIVRYMQALRARSAAIKEYDKRNGALVVAGRQGENACGMRRCPRLRCLQAVPSWMRATCHLPCCYLPTDLDKPRHTLPLQHGQLLKVWHSPIGCRGCGS